VREVAVQNGLAVLHPFGQAPGGDGLPPLLFGQLARGGDDQLVSLEAFPFAALGGGHKPDPSIARKFVDASVSVELIPSSARYGGISCPSPSSRTAWPSSSAWAWSPSAHGSCSCRGRPRSATACPPTPARPAPAPTSRSRGC